MGKLKILTVAVMTLTLTFTSTVQSNAAPCSAKVIDYLFYIGEDVNGDPGLHNLENLFRLTGKAIKATKSKKLKAVLIKLETALEENSLAGLDKYYDQADLLVRYNRC